MVDYMQSSMNLAHDPGKFVIGFAPKCLAARLDQTFEPSILSSTCKAFQLWQKAGKPFQHQQRVIMVLKCIPPSPDRHDHIPGGQVQSCSYPLAVPALKPTFV